MDDSNKRTIVVENEHIESTKYYIESKVYLQ